MGCEAIERQAIQTWQDKGASTAAEFLDQQAATITGQDRYRLLALKAKFLKRADRCTDALSAAKEAIDGLTEPRSLVDALISAMDLCAQANRTEDGFLFSATADATLADCGSAEFVAPWRATWHHNMGRLFMLDEKFEAARVHLVRALDQRKTMGQMDWAHDTALILAECLVQLNRSAEAEELCRWVRLNTASDYIRFRLDVVSMRVAIAAGNLDEAETFMDYASSDLTDKLGAMDSAVFIDMLFAEAELCAARNEGLTAERLRNLARRVKSASRR